MHDLSHCEKSHILRITEISIFGDILKLYNIQRNICERIEDLVVLGMILDSHSEGSACDP
jgi:hypothetical protein